MTTKQFQFIKITNNNKSEEYFIDITTMKDPRLRISALLSQYKNYLKDHTKKKKKVFKFFILDYSFCILESGFYSNYSDVKKRRDELYLKYNSKIKLTVDKPLGIVCFD